MTLNPLVKLTSLFYADCRQFVGAGKNVSATVATSSEPTIGVFKRFQKDWPVINKSSFKVADDDVFNGMPRESAAPNSTPIPCFYPITY